MQKNAGIERVTISLPTEILQVLDKVGSDLGHKSRSETVRAAMRDYIAGHRWVEEGGWRVGVVMLQYSHHKGKVVNQISRFRGSFRKLIRSSLSIPISDDDTMEIMAVQGEAGKIGDLVGEASRIRGVKLLRWLLTVCGRMIP